MAEVNLVTSSATAVPSNKHTRSNLDVKYKNTEIRLQHKVLQFYVTNELGLGNYFSYQCTKVSEKSQYNM